MQEVFLRDALVILFTIPSKAPKGWALHFKSGAHFKFVDSASMKDAHVWLSSRSKCLALHHNNHGTVSECKKKFEPHFLHTTSNRNQEEIHHLCHSLSRGMLGRVLYCWHEERSPRRTLPGYNALKA